MSSLLCTRELNNYLGAMIRDTKAIKQRGYKTPWLILLTNEMLTEIYLINEEGLTVSILFNEMRQTWEEFCSHLKGYDYNEPLCNEPFNPGTRLDGQCVVQSQDQLLRELLE